MSLNHNKITACIALVALVFLLGAAGRRELTWVAIGDSITYLNDHPNETDNRVTKGYMTRVVEQLPNIHYRNEGHNGWTAGRIASEIDKLGLVRADVYSVFLGTNDWWAGRPLGQFSDYQRSTGNATIYGSFRIILDKLRSLNPEAHIILITPMQRADFVSLANPKNNAYGSYDPQKGQYLEAVANAIDSISRAENLPLVDLYHLRGLRLKKLVKFKRLKDPQTSAYRNYRYPAWKGIPFAPDIDEYPYPPDAIDRTYDGLHPSDKGNAIISRQLVRLMKTY
jgi:lysophospholipase L1-like esterase